MSTLFLFSCWPEGIVEGAVSSSQFPDERQTINESYIYSFAKSFLWIKRTTKEIQKCAWKKLEYKIQKRIVYKKNKENHITLHDQIAWNA